MRDVGVRVQTVVRLLVRLRRTRRGRPVDHADRATVDDGVTVRRFLVLGGEVCGHVVCDGRGGAADEDFLLVGVHAERPPRESTPETRHRLQLVPGLAKTRVFKKNKNTQTRRGFFRFY